MIVTDHNKQAWRKYISNEHTQRPYWSVGVGYMMTTPIYTYIYRYRLFVFKFLDFFDSIRLFVVCVNELWLLASPAFNNENEQGNIFLINCKNIYTHANVFEVYLCRNLHAWFIWMLMTMSEDLIMCVFVCDVGVTAVEMISKWFIKDHSMVLLIPVWIFAAIIVIFNCLHECFFGVLRD